MYCLNKDNEVGIFYNYFRDYDPERGKTKQRFVPTQGEGYA